MGFATWRSVPPMSAAKTEENGDEDPHLPKRKHYILQHNLYIMVKLEVQVNL